MVAASGRLLLAHLSGQVRAAGGHVVTRCPSGCPGPLSSSVTLASCRGGSGGPGSLREASSHTYEDGRGAAVTFHCHSWPGGRL